ELLRQRVNCGTTNRRSFSSRVIFCWRHKITRALNAGIHHFVQAGMIADTSWQNSKALPYNVETGLNTHHPAGHGRWIHCDGLGIRPSIVKRREAEQSEMCSEIEENHSGSAKADKTLEFRYLFRISLLREVGEIDGGRVTNQRPTRAQFDSSPDTDSKPHLIP